MNCLNLLIAGFAGALTYLLVGLMRRNAVLHSPMDIPNERSSHHVATPRGGGVGIVIAFIVAVSALWATRQISQSMSLALIFSGSAIAVVGYFDDLYDVKASTRFFVHLAAATLFVFILGGYSSSQLARWGFQQPWMMPVISVLVLVWSTNLFNFMDGIDGIAGSECLFVAAAAALLNSLNKGDPGITAVLCCLSAASLGFLFWNWPPARIFMGDVGSGFLGFIVCACLMLASEEGGLPIEVLPILGGVFLIDTTTTLIRRMVQGDRWLEPHRTHAYQWLARKRGGHRPVTLLVIAVNLVWLLPWAIVTVLFPSHAHIFLAAALLPLVIIAIVVGAGRRELTIAE
jgi:Fuc2NAc and GlcNAc transferase